MSKSGNEDLGAQVDVASVQATPNLSAEERAKIFEAKLGQDNYWQFIVDGGRGELARDPGTRSIKLKVTSEYVGTGEWNYTAGGEFRSKHDFPGHLLGELSGDQYLKLLTKSA